MNGEAVVFKNPHCLFHIGFPVIIKQRGSVIKHSKSCFFYKLGSLFDAERPSEKIYIDSVFHPYTTFHINFITTIFSKSSQYFFETKLTLIAFGMYYKVNYKEIKQRLLDFSKSLCFGGCGRRI